MVADNQNMFVADHWPQERMSPPAFERCVSSGKTSLIEIHLDPQAITTQTTLDAIRAKALKR